LIFCGKAFRHYFAGTLLFCGKEAPHEYREFKTRSLPSL